jgi:ElaB/YqjD/DUF883 family membrane-anchored ribosome-binding protein
MDKAIETDVAALAEEVKHLRTQLDKIVALLGQTAIHGSDEALRNMREAGERAWTDAKSTADELVQRVEQKPVQSALAALGIGFLVGIVLARR